MANDYLFVTSVPSFYKNLLFRAINSQVNISVFYSYKSPIKRHQDFFKYLDRDFVLCDKKASTIQKIRRLTAMAKKSEYVYYGGWDDPYYWLLILITPRRKNIVMVESNVFDLRLSGVFQKLLNLAKKLYLRRAACCMVSGTPHGELVKKLGFTGKIKYLYGVGILDFDYPPIQKPFKKAAEDIKNFLFIGRISELKGIGTMLKTFQQFPGLTLHLVGELEDEFAIENFKNVQYHGYLNREDIVAIFNACDVFILPSLSEPWGLVVEEALYHGLPAIVSNRVGCSIDVVIKNDTGIVFEIEKPESLHAAINSICNPTLYNKFALNAGKIDFKATRDHYINTILSATN